MMVASAAAHRVQRIGDRRVDVAKAAAGQGLRTNEVRARGGATWPLAGSYLREYSGPITS